MGCPVYPSVLLLSPDPRCNPPDMHAAVAQLAGRGVIDDVFALCFGSVEGDGALMLGDVSLQVRAIIFSSYLKQACP